MNCAVCGAECAVLEHRFFAGLGPETHRLLNPGKPWRPQREWTREAPLYFAETPDGAVLPFCGAAHALEWHERRRA